MMADIKIIEPKMIDSILDIRQLLLNLADESDNFPFTSEDMNMSDENIKSFLDFLIKMPNSTLVLAYVDKQLVGLGFLEGGKKARTYHLASLGIGVLQLYKNRGIGSQIIDKLIDFSHEGEYIAKIDVLVRLSNQPAISLYKRKGFLIEGKSKRALFIDGEFHDMLYMGLEID